MKIVGTNLVMKCSKLCPNGSKLWTIPKGSRICTVIYESIPPQILSFLGLLNLGVLLFKVKKIIKECHIGTPPPMSQSASAVRINNVTINNATKYHSIP